MNRGECLNSEIKTPSLFLEPSNCCGCTACASACPVNAIQMVADVEGFLYPRIDTSKCIGCKTCERVCQAKSTKERTEPLRIFAAKNNDYSCRMNSSSGGVFSLLAEHIEKLGGAIYGAAFDDAFHVRHLRATCREEWKKFCTSKYVQSDLGNCYSLVKKDLEAGLPVLFSGTPCQVEGLNRFLNTSSENLITCDIVCHGVSSPLIWQEWLDLLMKRTGTKINWISFRDKTETGWHSSSLSIRGENNSILLTETHSKNVFSRLYFRHLIVRPSCHHCQYASFHRPSDITLGDYWGIETHFPDFDDDKGVTLVMCNTIKGIDTWNQVYKNATSFSVSRSQSEQPNLLRPSTESKDRHLFWMLHRIFGLNFTLKILRLSHLSPIEKVYIKIVRAIIFLLRKFRDRFEPRERSSS